MTQQVNVYKHAAGFNYQLNYAIGATSWTFTSGYTGKLTKASLTNIASFTINSSAATFPFQLTSGNTYAVNIVPTDSSLVASITLYADDIDAFTQTYLVPNIIGNSDQGRYLYVLTDSTLYKLDTALLASSNYAGSGAWTTTPIVTSISLPSLPHGFYFNKVDYINIGSIGYMLLTGGGGYAGDGTKFYFSKVKISDDTVWDINLTTQNTYSTLVYHSSTLVGPAFCCTYDMVNNYYYIFTRPYIAGNLTAMVNLNTNAFNFSIVGGNFDYYSGSNSDRQFQFDPINQRFPSVGDSDFVTGKSYSYKIPINTSNFCAFDFNTGYSIQTMYGLRFFKYFDKSGVIKANYGDSGGANSYTIFEILRATIIDNTMATYCNQYCFQKAGKTTFAHNETLTNAASGQTQINCITPSNYASLWFAKGIGGSGVYRLHLFNPTLSDPNYAYLDFSGTPVNCIATNQFLL